MRIPSGVGGKFPTQKPAIDKVAEHIDDVVTVAESITSGQFDKVSVPAVKVVATSIKEVTQVAEVEQYVRMLAQDLSNIDLIGSQLAGVLNVSNNMAVVLLLHSRMADLLDIKKSLVHIDAVAINEERINSVYEIIPEIATLVSHTDKLVRIAGMEPQLEAVFENLDAIFLIGSNVGHIVNVSTNMETILEASAYADAMYTLIEHIKESEAHIVELEASSKVNAEEAAKQALEAKAQMVEATKQVDISTTQANAASGSAIQAAGSATAADTSQKKATTAESNAKVSETNAASSAAKALVSEGNAKKSEDNAKLYEADARASMMSAAGSATTAGTNANLATAEANKAKDYAFDALTSKNAADSSATTASTGATTATTKASKASSSASAAKVSQDAAKVSEVSAADSLSKIGSAIADSSVPFPDVWIPFNDSLRMLAGYGDDIKVGDYTVATQASFSRASTATYIDKSGVLRTAAINEPRFGKEGLLIEGQSTNMVVQSEISPVFAEVSAYTSSPSAVRGYNLHSCVYTSGDDALIVHTGAALQAPDGTASFVFNSATIVGNWVCYFNDTDVYVGFWPKNSSAFEYADLGNGLIRVSRKLKGTALNIIHLRCAYVAGSRIDVGCYQIEALPFATSYIPTNGAAATRAADVCSIQARGNWVQDEITWGAEYNLCSRGGAATGYADFTGTDSPFQQLRHHLGFVRFYCDQSANFIETPFESGSANITVRKTLNESSLFIGDGTYKTIPSGRTLPATVFKFGGGNESIVYPQVTHIRNFRIWHRALTDAQIKGLK